MERRVIEQNRRNRMRTLNSRLTSLLPLEPSQGRMTVPAKLEEAAKYIKRLENQLQEAKERRDRLLAKGKGKAQSYWPRAKGQASTSSSSCSMPPRMEIHETGSALEIFLVTVVDHQFLLCEVIRILHQETVEVLNANLSVIGNTAYHSVHAKIEESMFFFRAATVREKLNKLVGFQKGCVEGKYEEQAPQQQQWSWDNEFDFGASDFMLPNYLNN